MKRTIRLDYGRSGLVINLENADVILPADEPGAADPEGLVRQKLREPDFGPPLSVLAAGKKTAAIAHTDITRATPNALILPPILETLAAAGLKKENITLVNMTGSHRPQTAAELEQMLGKEIVRDYRCVQHDSFDKTTMLPAGTVDGQPLFVNKAFMQAELKICTGFIEPHFFAGFSGGPKAILPGLCDIASIMKNHGAANIDSPRATWGITEGNPVWEHMRAGCAAVNPDFLLNVALNTRAEIAGVFAGEWQNAHTRGCEHVRRNAMCAVKEPYDIVITSNSGYPLDMNVYQCVKAMSCAAQIVRDGGSIIVAGECADGIPDNSAYHKLLKSARNARELYASIMRADTAVPEQWQVQIQTRIQNRASVYLFSDTLSDEQIRETLLKPCRDIERLVLEKGGRVAVLPKGPQTIPYLLNNEEDV